MDKLDVYYCTACQNEFAVHKDAEPQFCPFCKGEIDFSHTVEGEE